MNDSLKKKTIKNVFYAFSAQFVSILLSVLLSLAVPKLLGVEDFSYWQLFLFYLSYVGFFHLGITDGMYLKIGGKKIEDVNKRELCSHFYCLLGIQIIFFVVLIVLCNLFIFNNIRKMVLIATGLYMVVANLNWYLGYIFQATNRVKLYSISVIIDKILFLLFIVFVLVFKIKRLDLFIFIYVLTTTISLIYSLINSKEIFSFKPYDIKTSFNNCFDTAKIGINLTLSSISSILILGVGRFLIDNFWGITVFGKFSFALSLANFFLLFISQVSLVMFPVLRMINVDDAKELFLKFNSYLETLLPLIYVVYIPIKMVLSFWLPQYAISLDYLGFLLPLCIFDGKTQMINNTYFKVLRKEKDLLKINLVTLIISSILSFISVFVIKNLYFVILGMVLAIIFRCLVGQIYLSKKMDLLLNKKNLFFEIFMAIIFILINLGHNYIICFILTIFVYLFYVIFTGAYIVIFDLWKKFLTFISR